MKTKDSNQQTGGSIMSIIVGFGLLAWGMHTIITQPRMYDLSDLSELNVVLIKEPNYDTSTVKRTIYESIYLYTEKYEKPFYINNYVINSVDHESFQKSVNVGDTLTLLIPTNELSNLNKTKFVNDYNEIYGVSKGGYQFIDQYHRLDYQKNQNKWGAYLLLIFGGCLISNGLILNKSLMKIISAGKMQK